MAEFILPQEPKGDPFRVSIGDRDFRVVDGDTVREVDRKTGKDIGKNIRLQGIDTRETDLTGYYKGFGGQEEAGGQESKVILYNYLDRNSNKLNFQDGGTQEYGAGSGSRYQGTFVNSATGLSLADDLASEGLSPITTSTSAATYEAARLGELRRSVEKARGIEDKYADLRGLDVQGTALNFVKEAEPSSINPTHAFLSPLKGNSFDETDFHPALYKDVNWSTTGAQLWDQEAQRGGTAIDPLSTAWTQGWSNLRGDLYGFVDILGQTSGSESLSNWARAGQTQEEGFQAGLPGLAIQNFTDISKNSEGVFDGLKNGWEWLTVNGAMSIPYLAGVAAATATGALAAPVIGATTASLASSAALGTLYAGNVWNQFNAEERTADNAAIAYGSGVIMASLDKFGLHGIIKPSQLFSKEGREIAYKALAKKNNITEAEAKELLLKDVIKNSGDVINDIDRAAALKAARGAKAAEIAKGTFAHAAAAGTSEGLTEVGQELLSLYTAAGVNGEEVTSDQALNVIANSFAAGFGLGGAIAGTTTVLGAPAQLAQETRKYTAADQSQAGQKYIDAIEQGENAAIANPNSGITSKNVADRLLVTKVARKSPTVGFEDTTKTSDRAARYKSDNKLFATETGAFKVPSIGEIGVAVRDGVVSLVTSELRKAAPAEVYGIAPSLGLAYKIFTPSAATGATNIESYADRLRGRGSSILKMQELAELVGVKTANEDSSAERLDDLAATVNEAGLPDALLKYGTISKIPAKELAAIKSNPTLQAKFKELGVEFKPLQWELIYNRTNNTSDFVWDLNKASNNLEYQGTDSKAKLAAFDDSNKLENYAWTSSRVDPIKVRKNKAEATMAMRQIREKRLREETQKLQDAKTPAERRDAQQIINMLTKSEPGAAVESIADQRSVDGLVYNPLDGDSFAMPHHKRIYNLSEETYVDSNGEVKSFRKEFMDNRVFSNLNADLIKSARKVALTDMLGDGGADMDYLLAKGEQELIDSGYTPEAARAQVDRIAAAVNTNVLLMTGNYKADSLPKAYRDIQRNLMTYTTFVAMPLATLASSSESAVISASMISTGEGRLAVHNASAELKKLIKDSIDKPSELDAATGLDVKLVNSVAFDYLREIGVPVEMANLYVKQGVEEGRSTNDTLRKLQDSFFHGTGLNQLTIYQRINAMAFGLDSFRVSSEILMNAKGDAKSISNVKLSNEQQAHYTRLRDFGVNVDELLASLTAAKAQGITTKEALEIARANPTDQISLQNYATSEIAQKNITRSMENYTQNFVNFHIQHPQAANRGAIWQDPRFALLTQFNGFMSAFTTTVVPKMWSQQFGAGVRQLFEKKAPTELYPFFQTAVVMLVLASVGQWMKDSVKAGEFKDPTEYPYGDDDDSDSWNLFYRALKSTGILGQYEKPLGWFIPDTFGAREGFSDRVQGDALGPLGIHFNNVVGAKDALSKDDTGRFWNNVLKSIPGTATFPTIRHGLVENITGQTIGKP